MQIRIELEQLVTAALKAAVEDGTLALETLPEPALERPKDESNGDWASTVALRSAKLARRAPRDIAQAIVDHLPENDIVASVDIAGPGFINFMLAPSALQAVVAQVRAQKADFGRTDTVGRGQKVNLEYVSANPTGPMHVGHGRWAALGNAMARVMRFAGYEVSEEFYVNDHGVQMDVFANSIVVRYLQLCGQDVEMPEKCYGGAYIRDIAQAILDEDGTVWVDADPAERELNFRERGYAAMLASVQDTLSGFGNSFDTYFSERSLYVPDAEGKSAVDRALEAFDAAGYVYQKDGATWFRSSAFGDEKDRVLIKGNGEMSYFMSDCAYHFDKLGRGYDLLIDIWGADHHGYVPRCEAMMAAWNRPGDLEVVLGQLVNLLRDGVPVRMSKRTGEMVTFNELIDEVGPDATKYLMLSRSSDQAIDFDIEVAKKRDATNPVYYVQYAHARICSILRKAAGVEDPAADIDALVAQVVPEDADLSLLVHESELALMRKMDDFADLVAGAARDRAPFRLTHYAQELASLFHSFYTNCHVLGVEEELSHARLALADAARINLAQALDLLGVTAPTSM
ncbi:MAG: arginine--tRNA ligase [Coriobacteriaceae bacterium]|nr:arginine--tRNA ligase [Coriobacteriaceae bacterium]